MSTSIDLDAIKKANEERKTIRASLAPAPWHRNDDGTLVDRDGNPVFPLFGPTQIQDEDFVIDARNDDPEEVIDQLISEVKRLQQQLETATLEGGRALSRNFDLAKEKNRIEEEVERLTRLIAR